MIKKSKDEITEKDLLKEVSAKLDKIIALLTVQNMLDKDDKIYSLKKLGLSSPEVGLLLGSTNVRVTEGWKRK